jgi:putative oxidoreductase
MKSDVGLLVLRVSFGLTLMTHGWGKVTNLFSGQTEFPDPLGIGSLPSLILAALGEFVFALLVAVGFKTSLTAIPPLVTMLVAGLVFHWYDPFAKKEPALMYAAAFLTLVLTGGGSISVDAVLRSRSGKS